MKNTRFFVKYILISILSVSSQLAYGQKENNIIKLLIKLEKPADAFSIKIAPLKYNKDFAFSFTLDDGLVSDYLVAFPYFKGGTVSGKYIDQWGFDQGADGEYYPGLFYTDGCGHSIPFKAGIAINAKNINGADTIFHHGFLTWKQIKDLSEAGWDILNHGYSHATGKNANVKYEIKENNEAVKKHIGIEMKDFVIPGGHDDYISDTPYTKRAFEAGMETVQCEHFGNYLIKIDSTLNLAHLKLGRKFLHTSGTGFPGPGDLESLSQNKKFWINAFTHGVGNQNIWNISLIFPQFRSFFQKLYFQYGQKGEDNMWFAPTRQVYEYLLLSQSVKYIVQKRGKRIIIKINTDKVPGELKYHELTFLFNGDQQIKKVKGKHCNIESYSKRQKSNVINVKW